MLKKKKKTQDTAGRGWVVMAPDENLWVFKASSNLTQCPKFKIEVTMSFCPSEIQESIIKQIPLVVL